MAPLVVKDKVFVGNSCGEFGVRGWLTALDISGGRIICAGLGLFAGWLDARKLQWKGQALTQRPMVEDGQRRTAQRLYGAVERMLIGGLLGILVALRSCTGNVAREATELIGGDLGRGLIAIR
jgi:hypothetical protein